MPDPKRHARAGTIRAQGAADAATAATVAQSSAGDKRRRRALAPAAAVFVLAAAVYANVLPNGFVSDDRWIIVQNPLIRSLAGIPRLFTLDYWHGYLNSDLYRPVTMASFALNYAIGGVHPGGYHAVNAFVHGLCAVLVFFIARRFWRSGAAALVAGALFALHPVHTEAVAAGFGRSELLAAAGVLGALLLHARAREVQGRKRAAFRSLAIVSFAAGAYSKESAFVFPALAALADAAEGLNPMKRLRDYAPYVGAALVLLGVRAAAIAGPHDPVVFADNPLAPAPLGVRLMTATAILGRYIGLLFWPARLSADYSYAAIMPISKPGDPSFLLGLAAVAAFAALGIVLWRRSPGTAFGVFAFFVAIAPTANLLVPIGTIMAERLLYLPSISVCFLGAAAVSAAWRRRKARTRAADTALAVVVCAVLAARTVDRNRDWRDNRTLFESALAVAPNSFRALTVLAEIDMDEGNDAAAKALLERAIKIWPKWSDAFWRLGSIVRRSGDISGAQPYFREAVRLEGTNRVALFSLAESEQQLGHLDQAVQGYVTLESIEPCCPGLHQNLGYALRDLGRLADAESAFRRGLGCAPDSAGLYRGLATVLEQRGDHGGAEEAYRGALAHDSTDAIAANNLAWMLAGATHPSDEALSLAERALRLEPDATVYDTIAWIRYKRGDLRGAGQAIREAVRLDSANAEIRGRRDVIEAAIRKAGGREGSSS